MRGAVLPALITGLCIAFPPRAAVESGEVAKDAGAPYLLVLGIAQDGGVPHPGCMKTCCRDRWGAPERKRHATALAVVDPSSKSWWLFEATPDLPQQLAAVQIVAPELASAVPQGVFLTHAHIGHYAGLMYLGREAMGTSGVSVYAMPRLKRFLEDHGPWSQLVSLRNIALRPLQEEVAVDLSGRVSVTPFQVPHREEFSETVGYRIRGPARTAVFIPDIDKWAKWRRDVRQVVREVDLVFIDGSFYQDGEIAGRDMKEIPHPFIEESMALLSGLTSREKDRVHFIHLNHTNPALIEASPARKAILEAGFHVALEGWRFEL